MPLPRIVAVMMLWTGALLIGASLSHAVTAWGLEAKDIAIKNPWVRTPVPGQQVAAAYMDIVAAQAARLVKVETPAAAKAEIHSMTMDHGVMHMRPVTALPLPKGAPVKLAPGGGYHLMLTGLKQPLKAGDNVALRLTVQTADGKSITVPVNAPVKAAGP